MDGPLLMPPRTLDVPPDTNVNAREAAYAANRNQKNAVLA
jgi:hypothetical protein